MQNRKASRRGRFVVNDEAFLDSMSVVIGDLDNPEPAALYGRVYEPGNAVCLIRINRDEVMDLLRQAGAPERWQNPEACAAICIIKIPIVERPRTLEDKAQDLVNQLRRVLPELIRRADDIKQLIEVGGFAPEVFSFTDLLKEKEACQRLLETLEQTLDLRGWRAQSELERLRPSWHALAVRLLTFYRAVVDQSCGIFADSAAIRFIDAVLERVHARSGRTRHAIAKALQRSS